MYLNWEFAIAILPVAILMAVSFAISSKLGAMARGRRPIRMASVAIEWLAYAFVAVIAVAILWQFIGPVVGLFLYR